MSDAADEYLAWSRRAADLVVRRYSTSFTLASRLLSPQVRTGVRDVYAFVRVADEVVDGAVPGAAIARTDRPDPSIILDRLEGDLVEALATGFSTNPVLHAFAATARTHGITMDDVDPFLDSMRADLAVRTHDRASLASYVHGSAEVVGLMCLRVFLAELPPEERDDAWARLSPGATSLGAAFQHVNFLRDVAEDRALLGRDYVRGMLPPEAVVGRAPLAPLTEDDKQQALAVVRADLAAARPAIEGLPEGSRHGVAAAYDLFSALADAIDATPVEELNERRVRLRRRDRVRLVAPHLGRAARAAAWRAAVPDPVEHAAPDPVDPAVPDPADPSVPAPAAPVPDTATQEQA